MRISDWSSDVCSSDLHVRRLRRLVCDQPALGRLVIGNDGARLQTDTGMAAGVEGLLHEHIGSGEGGIDIAGDQFATKSQMVTEVRGEDGGTGRQRSRSEEDTSELQSRMRMSEAGWGGKKKKKKK